MMISEENDNNSSETERNYSKATSLCRLLVDGALPMTQTALTGCIATLRRCIKNENEM